MAKFLTLSLILSTHYVSYSAGSLEAQAYQLTLTRAVRDSVEKTCPQMKHKFDAQAKGWKETMKMLSAGRIRDLTRFEPDTATVNFYTNWVCSGGGGRHIFNLPSRSEIQANVLGSTDEITNDSESSDDHTEIEDYESTKGTSASYFDLKLNTISFMLGCLTSFLITYSFAFRAAPSVTDVRKLRRPEL